MTARGWIWPAAVICVLGCAHDAPFTTSDAAVGPPGVASDLQITFNVEQDYWPAWTQDGKGILYSFVVPEGGVQHRCLGLLPAAGGRRLWQLCDTRYSRKDSVSSFTAYALAADGRLLYTEATARFNRENFTPDDNTLWLADTAAPFSRRALLTLPTFAGATPVGWLAELVWTGPNSFLALGQTIAIYAHCRFCAARDSAFYGAAVIHGSITSSGAMLDAVPGTAGATGFAVAENGASIAFLLRDDRRLYQVPVTGGTPAAVGIVSQDPGAELLGVSCRGSLCVVASDPLTLSDDRFGTFPSVNTGRAELHAISLVTGRVQLLRTDTTSTLATPQVSPLSGDVVLQVGGAFGHLQTFAGLGGNLHLLQRLLP